jgi:hypothetical protein
MWPFISNRRVRLREPSADQAPLELRGGLAADMANLKATDQ